MRYFCEHRRPLVSSTPPTNGSENVALRLREEKRTGLAHRNANWELVRLLWLRPDFIFDLLGAINTQAPQFYENLQLILIEILRMLIPLCLIISERTVSLFYFLILS
jgi:hypothetical protein